MFNEWTISADMSSLSAQDLPQQRISGDERDFVITAEPIRQPFSAVFGPAEPFRRGELLRRDSIPCGDRGMCVVYIYGKGCDQG